MKKSKVVGMIAALGCTVSDFYTGCSNYSLEYILTGARKTELVSEAYDECSTCGAVK
ncbi:hypothetical protein [uncultured Eubacterium sp.]|uniref:hypothetical protein n=1 Tax=uncultured Eubacterium sp. TaxID=165185 RepID=UPI0025F2D7D8|nr:hypothetical protein [uncultured Eubacterium sp.]